MEQLRFFGELFMAWLLYLLVQALFINGIKLSATGTTEVKPDGTDYDSEMILYPVAKFLLQKTICKIFYKGEYLKQLYANLVNSFSALGGANVLQDGLYFNSADQYGIFKQSAPLIGKYLPEGVEFVLTESGITFYKSYDQYKFSKWIRKPVIQCIVCMGSFYGLFTFLIPGLVITGWSPFVLPAYLVNTFLLASVNKVVSKYC